MHEPTRCDIVAIHRRRFEIAILAIQPANPGTRLNAVLAMQREPRRATLRRPGLTPRQAETERMVFGLNMRT
jgi:hypothetical protein